MAKTPAPPDAASDTERDLLRLDSQLCFALYSTSLAMTKVYKPLLDALGLTYPQYLVMMALWEREGRTVGELGEQLFLDSGTLTPLLKRMEASGLLTRERAKEDERRVLVTLTPAGRALRERAKALPVAIAGSAGMSLEDIGDLRRRMQELRERLAGFRPALR